MGMHHSEQWFDNRRRHATSRCHQRRKAQSTERRRPRYSYKESDPASDAIPSGVSISATNGHRVNVSGDALSALDDRIMSIITGSEFDRQWEEYHRKHPNVTKDEYVGNLTRDIIRQYADGEEKRQKELERKVDDAQETAEQASVISMQATGSMADAYDDLRETHRQETDAKDVAYTSWAQNTASQRDGGTHQGNQQSPTMSQVGGRVMSNPHFGNVIKSMRAEALSKSLKNVQRRVSQLQMVITQMRERGNTRGVEAIERNVMRLQYQEQRVSDMIDRMR